MLKVFKYLKNSGFIIFIIMLLLAGQASCELSLPTYTSNIINIGIPKGPEIKKSLDLLLKAKLDGIIKNKEDEILFIKKEYGV